MLSKSKRPQTEIKEPSALTFNGHSTMNNFENAIHRDCLVKDEKTRETFEKNKNSLLKPRNPIIGESTPRNNFGETLVGRNSSIATSSLVEGNFLFPPNGSYSASNIPSRKRPEPCGKLAVTQSAYNILGNKDLGFSSLAQPIDLYENAEDQMKRRADLLEQKEFASKQILKLQASRHEKVLLQQISNLRNQLVEKERELVVVREKFGLG